MKAMPKTGGTMILAGEICDVMEKTACGGFWRLTDGSCAEWFPVNQIRIVKD